VIGLVAALVGAGGCHLYFGEDDDGPNIAYEDAWPAPWPPSDAGGRPWPDAGSARDCNVYAQSGCPVGEKCAWILDDPTSGLGHVGCAANGTVGLGGRCTEPETAGRADDCVAGAHCFGDHCLEICVDPIMGSCLFSGHCTSIANFDFGLCLSECDPLAQDCPTDGQPHGCYAISAGAICAPVHGDGLPAGATCMYLNECVPGTSCFDDGMGSGVCMRYCGPVDACHDAEGQPTMCGCGTAPAACGASEICNRILDLATAGVCVDAATLGCNCAQTPPCGG
jgi:hypothetical protein